MTTRLRTDYDTEASPSLSIELLGRSDVFLELSEQLARVARVDRPVVLAGERGTGKELAAARLHYLSGRWKAPFITLNCAALAATLIESELFGHEAGAFTGAIARRQGRFEVADGGTLFLDELSLMPSQVQEKILGVVEYGFFERVGGIKPLRVDVRIVAATNRDLPELAAAGRFKRDLLDRLCFEVLTLPPLRARGEDVLLLARHFAARMAVELGFRTAPPFSDHAEAQLFGYSWPGNVRELKNVIERAVFRSSGNLIRNLEMDPFVSPYRPLAPDAAPDAAPAAASESRLDERQYARRAGHDTRGCGPLRPGESLTEAVRRLELQALQEALLRARHNQKHAALLLGLRYHQFRALYRKHAEALRDTPA